MGSRPSSALEGIRTPNLLIRSHCARCGVQTCGGAGRRRATDVQLDGVSGNRSCWVYSATIAGSSSARLAGCTSTTLRVRYERHADIHEAFLQIAELPRLLQAPQPKTPKSHSDRSSKATVLRTGCELHLTQRGVDGSSPSEAPRSPCLAPGLVVWLSGDGDAVGGGILSATAAGLDRVDDGDAERLAGVVVRL